MSDICSSLQDDHRVIEKVLNAMESECNRIEGGGKPDAQLVEQAIQFIREFADGVHHHKEEEVLFPTLELAGVPNEGGPVGVMLSEHELGRQLVAAMETAIPEADHANPDSIPPLLQAMRGYVELLRGHIHKEDNILFPMANQLCAESQKAEIVQKFEHANESGRAVMERHRAWAESL